jgi:hypothetical protein
MRILEILLIPKVAQLFAVIFDPKLPSLSLGFMHLIITQGLIKIEPIEYPNKLKHGTGETTEIPYHI